MGGLVSKYVNNVGGGGGQLYIYQFRGRHLTQ